MSSQNSGWWRRSAVAAVTTLAMVSGTLPVTAVATNDVSDGSGLVAMATQGTFSLEGNTEITLSGDAYTAEPLTVSVKFTGEGLDSSLCDLAEGDDYQVTKVEKKSDEGTFETIWDTEASEDAYEIKDAGTYRITIKGTNDGERDLCFTGEDTSDEIAIRPMNVTANVLFRRQVYSGSTQIESYVNAVCDENFYQINGEEDSEVDLEITSADADQKVGYGTLADKNVGEGKVVTFNAKLVAVGSGKLSNYHLVNPQAQSDVTVIPKPVTVTWGSTELTYNGKEQAPTATLDGICGEDELGLTITGAQVDAGTNYVAQATLTGADANNYTFEDEASAKTTFSIAKATITADDYLAPETLGVLPHTGSKQELVLPGLTNTGVFKYAVSKSATTNPEDLYYTEAIPQASEMGTYHVFWMIDGGANYSSFTPTEGSPLAVTIEDRSAIVAPTPIAELTYNTSKQPLVLPALTNVDGATIEYAVAEGDAAKKAEPADDATWTRSIPQRTNAGVYRVFYRLNQDDVAEEDKVEQPSVAFVDALIEQAPLTATIDVRQREYDGLTDVTWDVIPSIEDGEYTISGLLGDDKDVSLFAPEDSFVAMFEDKNVGKDKKIITSGIELTGDDSSNYCISDTDVTATMTITPVKITLYSGIAAKDKAYDGTTTAEVVVDKDKLKTNLPTVKQGIETYSGETEDVEIDFDNLKGEFEDADPGKDKKVTFTLAFKGKDAGNYTMNKTVGLTTGNATITKASLEDAEVKLAETTYLYDGKAKEPAVTVTTGGTELVADRDYTVAYRDNVKVGTATATITGINNVEGEASATFKIVEGRTFADVNDSTPHHEDIYWLAFNGISEGWKVSEGVYVFRGTAAIQRADMAAFMFRLAVKNGAVKADWQPNGGYGFKDVNASTPHAREIAWCAEAGIAKGWSDGTFRPSGKVVRADMAAFLHRLAGVMGITAEGSKDFTDVNAKTAHAEDISWLGGVGISTGFKDGSYHPRSSVIRQDMAAFLHRLDDLA